MSGTVQSVALQQYQYIPNLDSPMVNPDLTITIPWYQLLIGLWRRTGGSTTPVTAQNVITTQTGAPAQVLVPVGTPYEYSPKTLGNLVVTRKFSSLSIFNGTKGGETVEFSRDGGQNWYIVGCAPVILPLLAGDFVRISWFLAGAPTVVWFPTALG
jgi:hypothetical protein